MKVLVTGAGSLLGQGIIRSLKRINANIHIIAVDPNPYSAGLYWANEKYTIPFANSPVYLKSIKKLLSRVKPDFLFIGTDLELLIFSKNKKKIEKNYNVQVIVSDKKIIEIANDKLKTSKFFKENNFEYPVTVEPKNISSLNELIKKKGFPLIVKPKIGARSFQVCKVNNKTELYEKIKITNSPIVQEYIGSDENEFTASALYFGKKCQAIIVLRRDLKDGNTYRSFFVKNKLFEKKIKRWTEKLKPFGPVNYQFRLNKKKNPVVFEINARFSGTTPLRAIMGFNEVEMCIQKLAFNKDIIQPNIKDLTILRHWSETVIETKKTKNVEGIK